MLSSPDLRSALETLNRMLTSPSDFAAIPPARHAVAAALNQRDQPLTRGPLTDELLATAEALARHPAGTVASPDSPLTLNRSGWAAGLVQMFAAPAWQTPDLRPLGDQPTWLWSAYARYLFAAPTCFDNAGHETRWAAHIGAHLAALVRMLEANRASSSVQAVAQLALAASDHWPAPDVGESLRLRRQHVGRLLTLLAPRLPVFAPAPARPDDGTPLRVALLGDGFSHLKNLLDPERIELTSYTLADLPSDIAARVQTLRDARFDAVIFAGDLTRTDSPLTALALHRVAPRQFATALCPHTTGLPEIDVFLGDSLSLQASHTERLGILPAALAFDPPASSAEASPSRSELGLPEDARLIVATAHPAHTSASIRTHWTRLLDDNAQARLILLPGTSGPSMEHLFAVCEHRYGDRVILAGQTPLEPSALLALLDVSDIYLPGDAPSDRFNRDLAQRLGICVPDSPARIDCLAFADSLTCILETACRHPDAPLIAPAVACDLATRHEEGNHLLALGRAARAVVYLLAAVDDPQAGPDVWHDLALALHANGQPAEAIQALETCVQRAPDRLDSWLLLSDWAADYGHHDLVRDIADIVRELAPADPRVTALAERLAS